VSATTVEIGIVTRKKAKFAVMNIRVSLGVGGRRIYIIHVIILPSCATQNFKVTPRYS